MNKMNLRKKYKAYRLQLSEEELEDLAKLAALQEEYKDVDLEQELKELNEALEKEKKKK
jgi:hypothetical protein